ncbi:DUF4181 domain-containing protein [Chryseomicrobium palamuruense]|uniref:DUF4181 domain-containing protein n=1 Tax=Chryseomicrobium palamuruense TaxID=682973 RepID=A0ABV8UW71_9BACL
MEPFTIILLSTMVYLVMLLTVIYILKRKWQLVIKPMDYYSQTHRRLNYSIKGIAILLLLSVGLYQINQGKPSILLVSIPFLMNGFEELLRIYMQKKYNENPKWIIISWLNFSAPAVMLLIILVVYFSSSMGVVKG